MTTEADTCRKYVVPKLQAAGWEKEPHSIAEQRTFTDGRILVAGSVVKRRKGKRADYLLRYTADFPLAVVEAKAEYKTPGAGLGQAKAYADILDLRFAYSTNGLGIVEFDYLTGLERDLAEFPTPQELWTRLRAGSKLGSIPEQVVDDHLLAPNERLGGKTPRYYQQIAINRALAAILQGKRHVLLTMATGTGKTFVAFQICWKLWSSRWNQTGEHRKPRILYLADRNILIDDPKDKTFTAFGDARFKIEGGAVVKSREMYFAIYQAIAKDEARPGLYREYPRDFFDLIIVDECHRGSARDDSNWREILDYFEPAYQLGMTATPLREENRNTYDYFGNPIYTYSLRQGIDDGFLAPYRVHRVVTEVDAAGWRPEKGQRDRYGREIPDDEYHTKDFEREVSLRARTDTIAQHLTDFLRGTDRFAKTIVFCVDQEHAEDMRQALNNRNADLVQAHPDYVCRVTSEEGDIGRGHLSDFQDVETVSPVILTTSQLLTTGVDMPTCRVIAIARVVGSMTEFKQIIGRGTRVRDDYGKLFFTILDYTGSATGHFADPEFDGDPVITTEQRIDKTGRIRKETILLSEEVAREEIATSGIGEPALVKEGPELERRKYYVDGGVVEIVADVVHELDGDGKKLRVVTYIDYTAEKVRTLWPTGAELRKFWSDPISRDEVIEKLEERGILFEDLATATKQPDADPFDLLCHVAYNAPLRTRRERAERLRREDKAFLDRYSPGARAVLDELLEKYAEYGTAQFKIPDILKVPPISARGNVMEIAALFGGADALKSAVGELQTLLYAA